jgi:hypothetical protein
VPVTRSIALSQLDPVATTNNMRTSAIAAIAGKYTFTDFLASPLSDEYL